MQQFWIILRSLGMMALGAVVVMVFSDPCVNCLNAMGDAVGVDGF